jgi:cobalt-zinc-cadmium efflux system outer membrane protein
MSRMTAVFLRMPGARRGSHIQMMNVPWDRVVRRWALWMASPFVAAALAQAPAPPLTLEKVVETAVLQRGEIAAARARADASAQRPAIEGALEDPMISPSIDHYPFDMMEGEEGGRYDWSVSIEQRLPLSGLRGHKRRAARAQAAGDAALAERTTLDVVAEAQRAFFMLRERRQMSDVIDRQLALARQVIDSAAARYSSGTGAQAEVLRAEVDAASLTAERASIAAQIRGAEAMLNVAMGLPATTPVGELVEPGAAEVPARALADALDRRPELRQGEAEVERALADIEVMRSMYKPMVTIRAGRASTMAEGPGAMLMIGVSVPLWRGRLRAGVAEARFMERMARADLDAMKLMVSGEVTAAVEELRAARELSRSLQVDVIPRASMAVDAALAAYSSGRGTLVSVTDAGSALWRARAQSVMAEARVGVAAIALQRALGARPATEANP